MTVVDIGVHMAFQPLPNRLYTAAQTRALDASAIEEHGIAGATLMRRAGRAAFAVLRKRWPEAQNVAIICGGGNNGGDGYVMALSARQAGLQVTVFARSPLAQLKGDARYFAEQVNEAGITVLPLDGNCVFSEFDLVVDALLGTGLAGELRQPDLVTITAINASARPVLAVDVPSGLNADTGMPMGACVNADVTVTFIGVKQGLLTGEGPAYTGELVFDDLNVPGAVYEQQSSHCHTLTTEEIQQCLPARRRDAHKGHCGHVLLVGGDCGFAGAIILAAQAAARTGAGLISVATRANNVPLVVARQPEVMAHEVEEIEALAPLLDRAVVVVIGPGLGQGPWGQAMLKAVSDSGLPCVVDADGLNLMAAQGVQPDNVQVITPHPAEAGRLLGCETAGVTLDRFAAVRALAERCHAVALLKGVGTLIAGAADAPVTLNMTGNPGMASGGMGDVLSGIIGALLAQGLSPYDAAAVGAWLHGAAADRVVARQGERGLLASDVINAMPFVINGKRE